jgi:leucyl/phenylalanyl-tRNA--protein transferase
MASRDDIVIEITPQVLLKAYACGIFPMAESADDPALYWIEPQQRGIILLDQVHVPRRLARTVRQGLYDLRVDTDFEGVISGCAASRPGRRTTWINPKIRGLYRDLFQGGYCHTIEAWQGERLVGGLYGVALNGAFFGESMFSTARDASKVALVHLCARLIEGGFSHRPGRVSRPAGAGPGPRGGFLRAAGRRQPAPRPRDSPRLIAPRGLSVSAVADGGAVRRRAAAGAPCPDLPAAGPWQPAVAERRPAAASTMSARRRTPGAAGD